LVLGHPTRLGSGSSRPGGRSRFLRAKFNTTDRRAAARGAGPIAAVSTVPDTVTYEGAPAYSHDEKSELFLLAVSNMVGENAFYETAGRRDARYEQLVRVVAIADPDWTARFIAWLRSGANMRSASLVAAAEAAHARLAAKGWAVPPNPVRTAKPGDPAPEQTPAPATVRAIIASALQRADEPGEFLAYWAGKYGRALPMPVKRGVADAARRLYTPYNLLKYDTAAHGFRFADVLDLCHPSPRDGEQSRLFRYALDRRHGRGGEETGISMVDLQMLLRSQVLGGDTRRLFDDVALNHAGMTWEDALSLAGEARDVDKAALWTALWPSMGYMALLRNLRNMDEAGVSNTTVARIAGRLADPDQVARSRQFPYRFLAAYENAPSVRWSMALDQALQASLKNLPELPGRTLVLIDTSASMQSGLSGKSKMTPGKAAAVFGVALAYRCGADLFGFADGVFRHEVRKGATVIREVQRFVERTGEVGHGTEIGRSIRATYDKHDRVFVISDMQTFAGPDVGTAVPRDVPLYGFNLGGYGRTPYRAGSPNRHEFGGLTDATFRMVPLLEAGQRADWPF
jgi:hypothetical protein